MMNDNIYTEFQLPLKGFYRHFKEMTETSKSNHFLLLIFSFEKKYPLFVSLKNLNDLLILGGVTVEDAEIYFPQETPKTTGIKRPTRSTPSSGSNAASSKRRK